MYPLPQPGSRVEVDPRRRMAWDIFELGTSYGPFEVKQVEPRLPGFLEADDRFVLEDMASRQVLMNRRTGMPATIASWYFRRI